MKILPWGRAVWLKPPSDDRHLAIKHQSWDAKIPRGALRPKRPTSNVELALEIGFSIAETNVVVILHAGKDITVPAMSIAAQCAGKLSFRGVVDECLDSITCCRYIPKAYQMNILVQADNLRLHKMT